ncbi:hypothetical protein NDU88_004548 [Pleurodeles waltl]|uniref:Uncharacterized protein n=1 Tax=Pleurodeles waltl TaxID=8319 RepID=A0AAV7V3B9_PLEWA|nr:hypothetical protein NDU88_004548 [Pleurodeles waltl]
MPELICPPPASAPLPGVPCRCEPGQECGRGGGRSPAVGPLSWPSSRYQQGGPEGTPGSWLLLGVCSPAAAPDQGQNAAASKTPGPGVGAPEARPRRETRPNAAATASPCKVVAPGKASGAPVPSRRVALTTARPSKIQAAPAGSGQAGSRGAPEAAPQPTGPPPGRDAVWAHQPQSPRRSHGEAERGHLVAAHTSHR